MFLGFFGLPFILTVAVVLLVLAGKNEADPKRERPAALYLSAMVLLGVAGLLTASYLTVHGLVELTDSTPTSFGIESRQVITSDEDGFSFNQGSSSQSFGHVNHDDDVSGVVGGVIVGAIALALLWFHVPKLQDLADNSTGPGARIYSRFLYVLCGLTLVVGLAAAGTAIYAVYGMLAPDTAGAGEVTDALRNFIAAAAVTAVAAALFQRSWGASEDLAAVGAEVVVVEEEPPPAPRRPRRAAPPPE
jgi:hypothetical protein